MVAAVRRRVELTSKMAVRRVRVDRSRTPEQALEATGRRPLTDYRAMNAMPAGEREEVEVVFFNLGRLVSDEELEKQYELRGLRPADPYSLAAVNETDASFADNRPNSTHWLDAKGNWCYAAFSRWKGMRSVELIQSSRDWADFWWFGGLYK